MAAKKALAAAVNQSAGSSDKGDKRALMGWVPAEQHQALKMLSARLDRKLQDLWPEAVELLLKKYGEKPVR